jgi:hypothetical protein
MVSHWDRDAPPVQAELELSHRLRGDGAVSENFGSRQEAAEHIRRADVKWTEAVRTFYPYTERLRRLADAAETQRKAFMFAEICDVKWKPRENTQNMRLAEELEPSHRVGPPNLWATFDQALEHFGTALGGDSIMAIAQAFGEIAQATTQIADAIDADVATTATG